MVFLEWRSDFHFRVSGMLGNLDNSRLFQLCFGTGGGWAWRTGQGCSGKVLVERDKHWGSFEYPLKRWPLVQTCAHLLFNLEPPPRSSTFHSFLKCQVEAGFLYGKFTWPFQPPGTNPTLDSSSWLSYLSPWLFPGWDWCFPCAHIVFPQMKGFTALVMWSCFSL